jgi:hypothetical protein
MKRFLVLAGLGLLGIALAVGLAPAWWVNGHGSITEAAAARLPDEVPGFFRSGGKHLAHFAGDPDRWKNRQTPVLRVNEEGNHFLDLEDLEGKELPSDSRLGGHKLLFDMGKEPNKVGTLPYAIVEGYERLMCAFADHRKDPTNESVRMKCLVYGGWLAHYTTDISMPLHTTRNYDGIVQPDGKPTLQKGIHAKIDGFPEKFKITADEISRGLEPNPPEEIWPYVMKQLKQSHTYIDRCYELDRAKAFDEPTADSRQFILERCRFGAQITMDIWTAAWKKSATLTAQY